MQRALQCGDQGWQHAARKCFPWASPSPALGDPVELASALAEAQQQIVRLQEELERAQVRVALAEKEGAMFESALRWRAAADKAQQRRPTQWRGTKPSMSARESVREGHADRGDPAEAAGHERGHSSGEDAAFAGASRRGDAALAEGSSSAKMAVSPGKRKSVAPCSDFSREAPPPATATGKAKAAAAASGAYGECGGNYATRCKWRDVLAQSGIPDAPPAAAPAMAAPAAGRAARGSTRQLHTDRPQELEVFKGLLADVLRMRERGEYDGALMDRYSDALVVLPDEALEEVYMIFTHIYTGEHSSEVLEWMKIDSVSEVVHGFIEMQTMKVGALLDTPEAKRVKMLERERNKARDAQLKKEKQGEKEKREAELISKLRTADQLAYESRLPLAKQWAEGAGDEKMVKRFQRRKELQLLVMGPEEMKQSVPSFQWTQMMTSGLEKEEVRALAHCLRQPGVPAQAAPFIELLRSRIMSFGAETLTADTAGGEQKREAEWLASKQQQQVDGAAPPALTPPQSRGVDWLRPR